MKKSASTTVPETETPETPAAPDVEWLGPLQEATTRAAEEWTEREAHTAALQKLDKVAPYVERGREAVEAARVALPALEQYQAATAEIRAAASAMG